MNTITFTQLDNVVHALEARESCSNLPIYHSARILNAQGEEWDEVAENDATFVELYLLDYNGEHDYDELNSLLEEVGVEIDRSAMLAPYAVERHLQDGNEPCAWLVEGDGECDGKDCQIYGYALLLKK